MSKHIAMQSALLLSCVISGAAMADSYVQPQRPIQDQGMYMSGWGGVNIPTGTWGNDYLVFNDVALLPPADTGFGFGLDVGYKADMFRIEAEVSYMYNSVKFLTMNWNMTNAMVNGYFDIPTNTKFTPYVGAGVGIASFSLSDNDDTVNIDVGANTRFAAQAIAGAEYRANQSVGLAAEYRFKYSSLPSLNDNINMYSSAILARFNYYFG